MTLKIITPPAQVISTGDLKAHLRVTDSSEDSLIAGYLDAAVSVCRAYTRRSIGSQTLELALDEFPASFNLKYGPVASVASVMYTDPDGFNQTMSAADYSLDNYSDVAWLLPVSSWPATKSVANAVKVQYVAGDLHPSVKTALFLMVGMLFDHRDSPVDLMEAFPSFRMMLDPAKVEWVMA